MSSTFFGISIANSALSAQKRAMEVLGYNIAHANDPTYKRQRLVLSESGVLAQSQEASMLGVSPIGSGVRTGDVQRVRDALIENRTRETIHASANWSYMAQAMSQLESTIGEPSDTGLLADLDQFWAAWNKVATAPDSLSIRSSLLEDAQSLCQRIQYEYMQMRNMVDDLNLATTDRVNRVNLIAQEIAKLNTDIGALEPGQVPVNDLENRRDALVTELSKLVKINQHGDGADGYVVTVGGRVLVQENQANQFVTELSAEGNRIIKWADDGDPVTITDGELKAITDLRDTIIPSYLSQLDGIATSLVESVNTAHRTGRVIGGADGGDFFRAGTTAANISLDAGIIDHPELVAASMTGAISDGQVALSISKLKDQPMPRGLSINQMYQTFVGDVGGSSATAQRQASAQELTLNQFTTQQQSISGVSLDEEMTNMIKFQQAYNAASRVLTVMDEMLSQVIQNTGLVGR